MENPVDDTLGRSFQFGIHGEALLVVALCATTSMDRSRRDSIESSATLDTAVILPVSCLTGSVQPMNRFTRIITEQFEEVAHALTMCWCKQSGMRNRIPAGRCVMQVIISVEPAAGTDMLEKQLVACIIS